MAIVRKKNIPTELANVAFIEDINAIQEKVERCYSKDRYEEFQEAVEKITERYFKRSISWWIVVTLVGVMSSYFLGSRL